MLGVYGGLAGCVELPFAGEIKGVCAGGFTESAPRGCSEGSGLQRHPFKDYIFISPPIAAH